MKPLDMTVSDLAQAIVDWDMDNAAYNPCCKACGNTDQHEAKCPVDIAEKILGENVKRRDPLSPLR